MPKFHERAKPEAVDGVKSQGRASFSNFFAR